MSSPDEVGQRWGRSGAAVSPYHDVKIQTDGNGTGRFAIDGQDVSYLVTDVTFEVEPGNVDRLTVGLYFAAGSSLISPSTAVEISQEVRDLLTRLGWTPPEGAS